MLPIRVDSVDVDFRQNTVPWTILKDLSAFRRPTVLTMQPSRHLHAVFGIQVQNNRSNRWRNTEEREIMNSNQSTSQRYRYSPQPASPLRNWRDGLLMVLALVGFGFAAWIYFRPARSHTYSLTLTAGSAKGLRHQIALKLAREASKQGLRIEVKETAGSEEALQAVNTGAIDLALAQGGLDMSDQLGLRQMATLQLEPLHLLVRPELAPVVQSNLVALRGKTINISTPGSGTHTLTLEVLAFVGLELGLPDYKSPTREQPPRQSEVKLSTLSYSAILKEKDSKKLPDALFTVSLLPSPVAEFLVDEHGYRLVALPFGKALALRGNVEDEGNALTTDQDSDHAPRVRKGHLYSSTIPAYTYSVDRAEPPEARETLGTRLLLVANHKVPPQAVQALVNTVYAPSFAKISEPPLSEEQLRLPPEVPWHPGTMRYLESKKPLIASDFIETSEHVIAIVASLLGGGIFFLGWLRRRWRRTAAKSLENYIAGVASIEQRAMELETSVNMDLSALLDLRRELSSLKREALHRFTSGNLPGEEFITGFLIHVHDVRHYISGLILHERDNLEDRAREHQDADDAMQLRLRELWADATGP